MVYKDGIKEGINQGIQDGIEQRNISIAKNMLNLNLCIKTISEITELTIEEINNLK